MSKISPDLPMAKILSNWPETIPVFLANHMQCVGCYLSSFVTLGEASKVYSVPLKSLIKTLDQSIVDARSAQRSQD